jgi:putative tricarboxylic transport membrane protein
MASLGLRLFTKLLSISKAFLFPSIIVICIAGTYSGNSNIFDLYLMLFFGVFGYLMKKFNFPVAPLLMGYVLAPLLEVSLIQSLVLSNGSAIPFFTRPISLFFILLTIFFILWSTVIKRKKTKKEKN